MMKSSERNDAALTSANSIRELSCVLIGSLP
jgi:hypothetical protein